MGANLQFLLESIKAFHANALSYIIYVFSTNWCLFFLVLACIVTAILGVKEQSNAVVREEQNIL